MPETQDWAAPLGRSVIGLVNNPITASEAGQTVLHTIGVAGRLIVLVSLTVNPDPTAATSTWLRDLCSLQVSGATSGVPLARVSLSPSNPTAYVILPPGQAFGVVGENINVTANTRAGSGSQSLVYDIDYYLQ